MVSRLTQRQKALIRARQTQRHLPRNLFSHGCSIPCRKSWRYVASAQEVELGCIKVRCDCGHVVWMNPAPWARVTVWDTHLLRQCDLNPMQEVA